MADPQELTEEDVFANDVDPLDGIRELRKQEGVADEDLPPASEESSSVPGDDKTTEGDDELEAFNDDQEANADDQTQNASKTEDTVSDTGDQSTETQDVSTEGKPDGSELQDSEEETTTQEAQVASEVHKFKAHGQEFEFTTEEIMAQFGTVFGQAMDYTRKMQQIAPWRKMISALEEQGMTQDQLNIAIDAMKGDKGALQQILKANDIQSFDLEPEEGQDPYRPTQYGKNDGQLAIEEVVSTISADPEYKITVDVIDNQWDQNSRDSFANNPNLIRGLHNDIKTGLFDQVAPVAMKMKVLDGNSKSDIEYYMLAGEQLRIQNESQAQESQQTVDNLNQQTQDAVQNADQASSEAQRKRAASSTRTRADRKGVIDYLDDDDEKFDEWYDNLMANN